MHATHDRGAGLISSFHASAKGSAKAKGLPAEELLRALRVRFWGSGKYFEHCRMTTNKVVNGGSDHQKRRAVVA